ncbi:MAG: hypothetical protein ACI4GB_06820 [Acutalibacteraceae bacterium]
MKTKSYNILSWVSLTITALYGISNLAAMILINLLSSDKIQPFIETVLTVDVYTWHIFGVFSIVSLLMKGAKSLKHEEDNPENTHFDWNVLFHLLFMVMSFIGIAYLFKSCF